MSDKLTKAELAQIEALQAKIDTMRKAADDLTDQEKALIFKEATRGADPSQLSPEYQNLIVQMFLNAVLQDGMITIQEMCQNSACSPVTYYKLMSGKYGPPVRAWLEGLSKTILSVGVLPLMLEAKKQAEKGSGKHLEIMLDYLGLLDGTEEKGSAQIQFVDKFIKTDDGFSSTTSSVPLPQKHPVKPLPIAKTDGLELEIE